LAARKQPGAKDIEAQQNRNSAQSIPIKGIIMIPDGGSTDDTQEMAKEF